MWLFVYEFMNIVLIGIFLRGVLGVRFMYFSVCLVVVCLFGLVILVGFGIVEESELFWFGFVFQVMKGFSLLVLMKILVLNVVFLLVGSVCQQVIVLFQFCFFGVCGWFLRQVNVVLFGVIMFVWVLVLIDMLQIVMWFFIESVWIVLLWYLSMQFWLLLVLILVIMVRMMFFVVMFGCNVFLMLMVMVLKGLRGSVWVVMMCLILFVLMLNVIVLNVLWVDVCELLQIIVMLGIVSLS